MTLLGVFIELTVTMLSSNRKFSREMEQEGSGVILNLTSVLHRLKLIRIQYVFMVLWSYHVFFYTKECLFDGIRKNRLLLEFYWELSVSVQIQDLFLIRILLFS